MSSECLFKENPWVQDRNVFGHHHNKLAEGPKHVSKTFTNVLILPKQLNIYHNEEHMFLFSVTLHWGLLFFLL